MVHTGGESLQEESLKLPGVNADEYEIAPLLEELLLTEGVESRSFLPNLQGFVHHEWILDASGFPMIYVPPLQGYLSIFPLSKVQLEALLASKRPWQYDDYWYKELLVISPRATVTRLGQQPYEMLFVTGLLPVEIIDIMRWTGEGIAVPDSNAWRAGYKWLSEQSVSVLPSELNQRLHPLARRLWLALVRYLYPQTMLQLSLMKNGVIEWINDGGDLWEGLGKTRPEFYPSFYDPLLNDPMMPVSQSKRNKLFGVRFFRRFS